MTKGRVLFGGLAVALSLAATGCPTRTSIGDVMSDPGRYHDKEVAIAGRVVNSYGALDKGVFEIEDGTGRMWVYTDRHGVPGRDAVVGVAGRVQGGLSYGGRNYGTVLRETRRRRLER
jgi:hypothetical protein